jgi:hypothetical protein
MTDSETSRNDGNDHVSKRRTPIPKLQVAIVLLIQFAEPITGQYGDFIPKEAQIKLPFQHL